MPTIRLSDALGLSVDGKLADGARLPSILPRFLTLREVTLDQVPFSEASTGLAFQQPVSVAADQAELTLGASGGGSLALIGPKQRALDEDDPFNQIAVNQGEIYVALGLDFSVQAGASLAAGPGSFGLRVQDAFTVKCYRRFEKGQAGFPTFGKALGETISSFLLPKDASELGKVGADNVLVISGTGTLSVSGGFEVSMPVQSLAAVGLVGDAKLEVKAGGSVGIAADVTLTSGYQIRLRRTGASTVELGVYRLKSQEKGLSVSARVGVSAKAGGFDLAEQVIRALSRQPTVDVEEFRKALPGEDDRAKEARIAGFEASIKSAVSTKLEASLKASFSSLKADEAAWRFEVRLDSAVSQEAKSALTGALAGDFTALTRDPNALPAGITQLSNILTRSDVAKQTVRVNLLGIVNFLSVAKIAQISTVERNEKGEITLMTDTSSASRLQALLLNVAGGDTKRLRKMLSENFLIEAAYRVAELEVLPPEFKSRHTYLEVRGSTNRDEMKNNLDVARVLALITPAEVERRLGNQKDFGRTTFYAELKYRNEVVRRLFLDGAGNPRSIEDYETTGRAALGALLAGDKDAELRMRYADVGLEGTRLWDAMKDQGFANIAPLFGFPKDSTDPRINAVISDFITITDWAAAMNEIGDAIRDVEEALASGVRADDAALTAARDHLKRRLAGVVKATKPHFGDPLGMIMVYLASEQDAEKRVLATGEKIERLEASSVADQGGGADERELHAGVPEERTNVAGR
jgi:hypothetical protein